MPYTPNALRHFTMSMLPPSSRSFHEAKEHLMQDHDEMRRQLAQMQESLATISRQPDDLRAGQAGGQGETGPCGRHHLGRGC